MTKPTMKPVRHTPMDGGRAFLPDPRGGDRPTTTDDLAEVLAEEFVTAATSAEQVAEDVRGELTIEELSGPFLDVTIPGPRSRAKPLRAP